MEEIKVGEYIKADGRLYKVLDIDNVFLYVDKEVRYSEEYNASIDYIKRDEAEKHSFNIIDLIEVGDYVNGKLITNVDKVDNRNIIEWDDGDMYSSEIENDKFIKSIVTKEMMKSIEYRIN